MLRVLFYLFLLFIPVNYSSTRSTAATVSTAPTESPLSGYQELYTEMHLDNIINYTAFEQAIAGYNKIYRANKDILTLIDFSKPSTEERFYVLDIKQKKLLFASLVSHGRNSGGNYATSFSNENGSLKSSLGFYVTENTYQGKNGYSLILNGLEKGINDRAKERAIVIHGASYSNPSVISSSGRLGRSLGCPALPLDISKPVINTIKNGTILYIYANNQNYLAHSTILSAENSISPNSIMALNNLITE